MKELINKLTESTPKPNVFLWLLTTLLYTISIVINEQFHVIHDIGLSGKTEAIIKAIGIFLYIFLTTLNFSQTNQKIGGDNPPPDKDDK